MYGMVKRLRENMILYKKQKKYHCMHDRKCIQSHFDSIKYHNHLPWGNNKKFMKQKFGHAALHSSIMKSK
jgi:hypothetical protein